jgi:hypothetical protein
MLISIYGISIMVYKTNFFFFFLHFFLHIFFLVLQNTVLLLKFKQAKEESKEEIDQD